MKREFVPTSSTASIRPVFCRWPKLDVITIGGTPTWGNYGPPDQHATKIGAPLKAFGTGGSNRPLPPGADLWVG